MEPRGQGGPNRAHRRPRLRISGPPEQDHHRQEQLTWRCRREYGALQFHIPQASGGFLRTPLFLHVVQRQERGVRGRCVPAERRPVHPATQNVSLILCYVNKNVLLSVVIAVCVYPREALRG